MDMMIKNEEGFGWGSLLISILLFLASWLSFQEPVTTILSLGIVYGIVAIVRGFLSISFHSEYREIFHRHPWPVVAIGIIELLFGFYLVLNPEINIALLPILFSVWFLADSIRSIVLAFRLRTFKKAWFWLYLVLGILGIALGIFLASHLFIAFLSISSLITVSFFVAAVIQLIDAFV